MKRNGNTSLQLKMSCRLKYLSYSPRNRQIIHYGPPKTMEEYYQQIGRAGRDGLESKCIMYCNSADFDQYKGDFYLGNLPLEMRSYQEMNIDALRQFAMSDDACRRAEILNFFNEKPSFGERCGTCDTCVTRATYSNDLERDFGETGARLTLYAISVLNNKQGISTIENLIKGRKIESSRYKNVNVNEEQIKAKVAEMKSRISGYKSRLPVSYFTKDLLPALIAKNFVRVLTQSMTMNGRNKVSTTHPVSCCLFSCSEPCNLHALPSFLLDSYRNGQVTLSHQRAKVPSLVDPSSYLYLHPFVNMKTSAKP
jgi:Superfamily II DNA helicase